MTKNKIRAIQQRTRDHVKKVRKIHRRSQQS